MSVKVNELVVWFLCDDHSDDVLIIIGHSGNVVANVVYNHIHVYPSSLNCTRQAL